MLYQELYCFNCGLCSGLDTGCPIGDRLDYNPSYNLGWVSRLETEKLAEFIEKHSAQRMEHPFFDFVEDYSMPPRVLEHYLWIGGNKLAEAEEAIANCKSNWPASPDCAGEGCLDNYILRTLKVRGIPCMIEEIDYGTKNAA